MPAQGRKNVHGKTGVRFKAAYTSSKYNNMLRNVVSELILHERVTVTLGIAKDVVKMADRLVTYAKKGDLHHRRLAASVVREISLGKGDDTLALEKLFTVLGPRYMDRNGGYTRILKLANRQGDNAPMTIVEFVK